MDKTDTLTVARIVEAMVFWYRRAKELEAELERRK